MYSSEPPRLASLPDTEQQHRPAASPPLTRHLQQLHDAQQFKVGNKSSFMEEACVEGILYACCLPCKHGRCTVNNAKVSQSSPLSTSHCKRASMRWPVIVLQPQLQLLKLAYAPAETKTVSIQPQSSFHAATCRACTSACYSITCANLFRATLV